MFVMKTLEDEQLPTLWFQKTFSDGNPNCKELPSWVAEVPFPMKMMLSNSVNCLRWSVINGMDLYEAQGLVLQC